MRQCDQYFTVATTTHTLAETISVVSHPGNVSWLFRKGLRVSQYRKRGVLPLRLTILTSYLSPHPSFPLPSLVCTAHTSLTHTHWPGLPSLPPTPHQLHLLNSRALWISQGNILGYRALQTVTRNTTNTKRVCFVLESVRISSLQFPYKIPSPLIQAINILWGSDHSADTELTTLSALRYCVRDCTVLTLLKDRH